MSEKPKKNKCKIIFCCDHTEKDPCIYFSGEAEICKHRESNIECGSKVATVPRIILDYAEVLESLNEILGDG